MSNYERFRVRLEKDEARLREMIDRRRSSAVSQATSGAKDAFSNSGDGEYADAATDTFDQELDMTMLNKYKARIAQVAVALLRLQEGTYGSCQRCKATISEGRLDAVPETAFCRDCEADVEAQA
jgi:RNA polymerase-binding transcription factor DksA